MSHQIENKCEFVSSVRQQLDSDKFIQLLASTTTFRGIPPDSMPFATLEDICLRTDITELSKNHPLELSEEGDVLFEILSGYVKICDRPDARFLDQQAIVRPSPALLAWRVPGELLGDFKFALPADDGDDSIVATDDCRLLRMPASLVKDLAKTYPQIYFNIASNLASKARKAGIRAQILRLPTIECKVAQLFIELIAERKTTEESRGHYVLNGTFRVDDLAAFIGYKERHTQEVIRELMHLGVIEHYKTRGSGRYEILDEAGLRHYFEDHLRESTEE